MLKDFVYLLLIYLSFVNCQFKKESVIVKKIKQPNNLVIEQDEVLRIFPGRYFEGLLLNY